MSASKIVENPVKGKATLVKEQPQKKQGGFSLSSFSSSTKTKEEPAPAAKPKGRVGGQDFKNKNVDSKIEAQPE